MLGHDDVGEDFEGVFATGLFEGAFEEVSGCGGVQVMVTVVASEGDEVVVPHGLVTL